MSHFTAVYDANVLYPIATRSLLLGIAQTSRFRARWTDKIHEEWIGGVVRVNPTLDRSKLDKVREWMDKAVPDCLVTDYEFMVGGLSLPDEKDKHILAAAIKCHAQVIVTENKKDFPADYLATFDIETKSTDEFLQDYFTLHEVEFIKVAKDCRARVIPTITPAEYVMSLRGSGLPITASFLHNKAISLI